MNLHLPLPREPDRAGRWAANLEIELAPRAGKTRVTDLFHRGPLRIQRPFHPEQDGTAHVYILHPPGGVAGGDCLSVSVSAEVGARVLCTVPAATKLYRTSGPTAEIRQKVVVRSEATLEWLPQETIAFCGTQTRLTTEVHLEEGARFLGWEILCLGRPASSDGFETGFVDAKMELWRAGIPHFIDRVRLGDGSETREAVWGLAGHSVTGTMMIAADSQGLAILAREALKVEHQGLHLGVTDLMGVTVIRYVGPSVLRCWEAFLRVWHVVRPVVTGKAALPPRIWSY